MVSYKLCLRQAVSLDHTRSKHRNSVIPSEWFMLYVLTPISLSVTFFLHPLKMPCTQLLPCMVQLFHQIHLSLQFLFTFSSSWTSNITLINRVSSPFLFSHHLCPPPPTTTLSSPVSISSSNVIASIILSLSLFSLICSERVIYTATTHAEWSGAEQSSEGSLTRQNPPPKKNTGITFRNATKCFLVFFLINIYILSIFTPVLFLSPCITPCLRCLHFNPRYTWVKYLIVQEKQWLRKSREL